MAVCRIVLIFVLSCLWQFSYAGDSTTLTHPKDRQTLPSNVRIVGGQEAKRNSHPFLAALFITRDFVPYYFCGGTLLTNLWVLTTAHCVTGASEVEVGLGVHNISTLESTQVWLTSTEFIIHEDYNATMFLNDIALIKLPEIVTFDDYIRPIEFVGPTSQTFAGDKGTVMGWGQTERLGSLSSVVNYVNVSIMSNEECASDDIFGPYIVDSIMCTSGMGYVGTCTGDAAAPLIHDGVQIGMSIMMAPNCFVGKPTGFARVGEYSEWILNAILVSNAALPIIGSFFTVVSFAVFLICNF